MVELSVRKELSVSLLDSSVNLSNNCLSDIPLFGKNDIDSLLSFNDNFYFN